LERGFYVAEPVAHVGSFLHDVVLQWLLLRWSPDCQGLTHRNPLTRISSDRAKELRSVLETCTREGLETLLASGKYPFTANWYRKCYYPTSLVSGKLSIADEILGTFGVESIENVADYCNAGDSYAETLMYVYGRGYRVGSWGSIVEGLSKEGLGVD
jgi:hypothetical protein